jgi:hypothetical protein
MRKTRPFVVDGDELAQVVHWQTPTGKLVIDVGGLNLTPRRARDLSAWLLKAAEEAAQYNFDYKKHHPTGSEE